MCDKLVFDLSQEIEGSPNVFVRKDWINILDNQNQNYNNNQSIVDTSQLSNSNKYMSYREAYFSIPFLVTLASSTLVATANVSPAAPYPAFDPTTPNRSADYAVGLKNWFGQIIHSFTLDYNGTTIVQQTPYANMWNSFKLMTSLSLDDVNTQGATIGFYPDDPFTWSYNAAQSASGYGVCNNTNYDAITPVAGAFNTFKKEGGNLGFLRRQQLINFDSLGLVGSATPLGVPNTTYADLISGGATPVTGFCTSMNLLWKSYISAKRAQTTVGNPPTQAQSGYIQYSIVATVYLKHVHSFFNMCPLLKGAFMKMTMNLNNTSTSFSCISNTNLIVAGSYMPSAYTAVTVSNPLGGVNPLMLSSGKSPIVSVAGAGGVNTSLATSNGGTSLFPYVGGLQAVAAADPGVTQSYIMNISVGATCLDNQISALIGNAVGSLSKSVYLYVPAYIFNPTFESAYLSSPVKQIKYTDIYQYQVLSIPAGQQINNLITNGIANVKSVLVLPFYNSAQTGFPQSMPAWQSPFDPAGTGPTSPMAWLTNFNIQVSGQNAIYNMEKYSFEQFNNQLYGQNAVNGGLTDGITSGLIDRQHFDMEYCYYYVNIERMLPVEQTVPKSIQFLGTNLSSKTMDYLIFIEYGNEIAIDALTGARV